MHIFLVAYALSSRFLFLGKLLGVKKDFTFLYTKRLKNTELVALNSSPQ